MSYADGMQLFKSGDYEKAAHEFLAVTDQDENNHKAWNALGICLSKIGQYDQASDSFQNALILSPDNETYRKNFERNDAKRQKDDDDLELEDGPVSVKSQVKPATQKSSTYQRNWLQVPLFFVPMIAMIINPIIGFIALVGCAWYIKTDAESINAGANPNASIFGKLEGWEWGALLFFFWVLLPIYSFMRESIYNENLGYDRDNKSGSNSLSITKIAIGGLGFIIFSVMVAGFVFGIGSSDSSDISSSSHAVRSVTISPTVIPTQMTAIAPGQNVGVSATTVATPEPAVDQNTAKVTTGENNAAKKALSYLKYLPFSRTGLIKQLEYDKFTHAEAEFGVDQSGADWNEQAAKKAKSYLDTMAFSRDGLIKQLVYDGFSNQQAEYGVNAVGL